jgi:hypothetical protein
MYKFTYMYINVHLWCLPLHITSSNPVFLYINLKRIIIVFLSLSNGLSHSYFPLNLVYLNSPLHHALPMSLTIARTNYEHGTEWGG